MFTTKVKPARPCAAMFEEKRPIPTLNRSWATAETRADSRKGRKFSVSSHSPTPALGSTHAPIQWTPKGKRRQSEARRSLTVIASLLTAQPTFCTRSEIHKQCGRKSNGRTGKRRMKYVLVFFITWFIKIVWTRSSGHNSPHWDTSLHIKLQLTPYSTDLPEKLTGPQLANIFSAIYGTRRFITAFTRAQHRSLFWARSIQPVPSQTTSWRSILILSSKLSLHPPTGFLHSDLPTKTLYETLLSPIYATCPAHPILLDWITRKILGEQYR